MKKLISTLVLALAFSFCAMAQSNTVTITSEGLTSLQTYGRALISQSATDETIFETEPGWPCEEQMTAALAQRMRDLANSCCCPVYICVQGSNCAWVLYMFLPTDPDCNVVEISEGPVSAY